MIARYLALSMTACAALALGACGTTAPARFYTLSSTATAASGPSLDVTVVVGPVSIPASVDRPELVTARGANGVDVDPFHRWAEPLNDGIARAVAGDLEALLGSSTVAVAPLANFAPAYRVTLRVQRFESVFDASVLVDAVWVVRKEAGGAIRSGHTQAREAVAGSGFDALAAAHSRALARISADIAEAIRSSAT